MTVGANIGIFIVWLAAGVTGRARRRRRPDRRHPGHGDPLRGGVHLAVRASIVSMIATSSAAYVRGRMREPAFVSYMPDGSRTFVFYLEGTAALSVGAEALDRIGAVDWLHVSGAALSFGGQTAATTWLAVERALASGTRISFDPNVRGSLLPEEIRRQFDILLDSAHVVLASAGELEALGGSEAKIVSPASDFVHQAASDSVISFGPDGRARARGQLPDLGPRVIWTGAPGADRGQPVRAGPGRRCPHG